MRRRSVVRTGVSSIALAAMRGLAVLAGVSVSLPRARATAQPGPLEAAADALGVNEIKTVQFIASGTNFTVGQNFTPDDPWPPVRVKSYNVLINYDTGNVEFYGGVKAVDDLPVALPKLVHCHLKDKHGEGRVWDFPAIGEGHVDFKRVLDIMAKGGFTGPMSVEIEFKGDPWPPLAEVNRAMKASHDKLASLGLS